MGFFKRLMQQILPAEQLEETTKASELLIKEVIKHEDSFYKNYEQWRKEGNQQGIIIQLYRFAQLKAENPEADANYFIHRSEKANGFYFHGESLWSVEDYSFFVEYLIEFLEAEGYRQENSQRKVIEKQEDLLTTEMFYLKPKLKYRIEQPAQQLYGSIAIEHRIVNENTNYVKLMSQVYQGRSYQPPKDFETLMHKLFVS